MKTKIYILVLISALIAVVTMNCNEDKVVTPTNTTPACETNNTAKVFFQNKSTTGTTYDVIWNGSRIFTLAPSEDSDTITVAAQISHTLTFKKTGSNEISCIESQPILAKCSINWFWCSN